MEAGVVGRMLSSVPPIVVKVIKYRVDLAIIRQILVEENLARVELFE